MNSAAANQPANAFIVKIADVIINPAIRGLFLLALLVFLWGVFQFIKNADNDTARQTGRSMILWGVIGMSIMVAAGGIIRIAMGTVNAIK